MSKLLFKLVVLIIIVVAVLLPASLLILKCSSRLLENGIFVFKKGTTTVIAGDSHAEASINPDLFPHSVSIAKSAENYFYTYYKLKHFIEKNPEISTVILGYSWHNFPQKYQESFLFGDSKSTISLYFPLLDEQGKHLIKSLDSSYLIPWAQNTYGVPFQIYKERLVIKELSGLPISRSDISYFGGYRSIKTSNIDEKNIKIKLEKYYSGLSQTDSAFSKHITEYFDKIMELCSQHNLKVVLVNTPVHQLYHGGIPSIADNYIQSLLVKTKSKYANFTYIDDSDFPLPKDCYYDGDHLNSKGAEKYTEYLRAKLNIP